LFHHVKTKPRIGGAQQLIDRESQWHGARTTHPLKRHQIFDGGLLCGIAMTENKDSLMKQVLATSLHTLRLATCLRVADICLMPGFDWRGLAGKRLGDDRSRGEFRSPWLRMRVVVRRW
jgi:hypothetical protein